MTPLALALSLALNATPPAKAATPAADKKMTAAQKPAAAEDLTASTRAWQEERLKSLQSEDGWLTLVGLFWLKEGEQTAGSAPESDLDFPQGTPAKLGVFTRKGNTASLQPAPGVAFTLNGKPFTGGVLQSDEKGAPDVLKLGSMSLQVILRGDKLGVRVKDTEAPARKQFHGIPTYPASAAWRVEARFEPSETPRTISVPNVLGTEEEMTVPGTLVFTVNGKEYRLTPVEGGSQLFIIFADETNKDATYGAGRFLYADMPKDGRVVLDFNRAYNPPCAFTRFATCPLPPRGNRLALRVEAGEKRAGDH
ncbi:DUF1684 domain-containing protein [Pyxidicoccus fallax]|uniref:DUF1684 domain-containing protein n=1 Tax=Pyxidicoccus fallax TaxID=394095 RepID=A0A848LHR6_9BACT|nr:DUF1684 domain-containing protein [Pyxidicoccus fallax]NMO16348.1 DUF1684 domain-containing protein [Pyxidicoccus fallax]NPC77529.1 DUF1684 domain-containing protein [Pyxidicoccus fallax]